ncbi:single-stranded-DNA-specific exonuclease RecJ [bacterium]|nr:single-stranded-DNA-specific exonuclease RecJ [bacterium]
MEKRWELAEDVDHQTLNTLCEELDVQPVVGQLLIQRGFANPTDAKAFFAPERSSLHDPFLFKDMRVAVDRLIEALQERQSIFIFGDYDVDGITSASLLYLFFRDLGGEVRYYIPNRQNEGYGLSVEGIETAAKEGAQLIVTVDCGITSIAEIQRANELGVDAVISDHHQPGDGIPDALAVINPKIPGSNYPFKELAGVGVAYKLAQGVARTLELADDYLDRYLDLVAVGTAADIVPLVDENRIFVRMGLDKLNQDPLVGIRALCETAHLRHGRIEVGQIIYGLAPRINAVGRLGSADRAVDLMITGNVQRARELSAELESENRKRRSIDTATLDEAIDEVESTYNPSEDFAIVLSREAWHGGVIGIVASRLIERYYRPTVMITVEDGIGKGSARSIAGFDIYQALSECSDLLEQFGGHTYAAGLTLEAKNIPEFRRRLNEVARSMLSAEDLIPKLHIDANIQLDEVDNKLLQDLKRFAPFGPNNPVPSFVSEDVQLSGYPRIVGTNHLKFKVRSSQKVIDCIGFNLGDRLDRLDPNRPSNQIVYTIEENEWAGSVYLQLHIQDVKNGRAY